MSVSPPAPRREPFRALRNRNYRLYVSGQLVSMSGTWMQRVSVAWLVLDLTGSPVALGTVTAMQSLPILLFSLSAGVVADRMPKRRLMLFTQSAALVQAALLGVLTITGAVQLWHVYVLALLLGCVNALDTTLRNSMAGELVGPDDVQSAVSLNSSSFNLARIAGPAIGGVIVATAGPGWCFLVNAASCVAVLGALALMNTEGLAPRPAPIAGSVSRQLVDGLRYAGNEPGLTVPLLLQAFLGTFGFNFAVILPLLARFAFEVGPAGLGAMNVAQGVGAVTGSLIAAGSGMPSSRRLLRGAAAFALALLVLGVTPVFVVELAAMAAMGVVQILYSASVQTVLQLTARPEYRGRVVSLYSLLSVGTTTIGSTATGALADLWGIRTAVVTNALICAAAVGGVAAYARRRRFVGT